MSSCHKSEIFICSIQNWILTLLLLTIGFSPKAQAQSIIPAQDGTATVVKQNGQQFNITGGQISGDRANLFHSFQQFNLNAGQIANFLTPANIKNILGRVVGKDASVINGLIKLTGGNANLFLLNPAGIVFGPNAQLNVPGSFTATTATGISFGNNWFQAIGSNNYTTLIGEPNQFSFNINQPGSIINQGSLQVGIGQNLNLIGGNVINTGNLTAPEGDITITAVPGSSLVKVSQIGHLLNLEITPQQGNTFSNITPLTLPQLLTGGSLNPATGITVDPTGQISLTSLGTTIPNSGNVAVVSGNLNVSGQTGGAVNVLGNSVNLINAQINASGISGGGQVLIGGGLHGEGTVPNAESTFVDQNTLINANALTSGNGGQVIVWADGVTKFDGNINALGGSQSGNGGFVETSGKNLLTIGDDAKVNTFAPQGKLGTWLLDPTDLTVVGDGSGTGTINAAGTNSTNASTINNSTIVAALNSTNVDLSASNSITVNAVINASANTQARNLTLSTPTINLYEPITLYTGSTLGKLSGTATTVNVGSSGLIQNGIDVAATGANINLAAATYTLSDQINIIDKSLNLIGAGENSTLISGNNSNRVLLIETINNNNNNVVKLSALSIMNGYVNNGVGAGIFLFNGTLNFSNGILSGNSAANGGGIYAANGTNLTLNNVTISNNSATGGGGIYNNGTTTVNGSTFSSNSAANGGGIYNAGNTTVNGSTFSSNSASGDGGGGIYNTAGTITVSSSNFSNNSASGGGGSGGGIYNDVTGTTVVNNNSNFSSNSAANGGGIYNDGTTTVNNSTFSSNSAANGGGICNDGTTTVNSSTFSSNSAANGGGGGIYNDGTTTVNSSTFSSNSASSGGGIWNTGTATVNSSTFSSNSASRGGGGIYNDGTTTVNSSTFSSNSAANGGGGIYNDGTTTVNGSTFSSNSAGNDGGIYNTGTANITSSSINYFTETGGTVTFNGDVSATQVNTDLYSIVNISGNINTTGSQIYDGAVTIANNPTLTASIIGFQSNVDGNSNLTINTSQGVNFLGAVGANTALGNLVINTGSANFYSPVNVASLTTATNGSTVIQGDITSSGALTYNNPVTIANNPDLTANSVTFASTIDGNSNLTINTQNGNVNFKNAVGNNVGLGDLTIENASNFVGESINANSITETAGTGNTTLGNLTTQGGGVNLTTKGNISTGNIATNGSDITLNGENITTGTLNTSTTNQGGNIDITALGSYRGIGTFIDSNGVLSSISTAGKTSGGSITINYGAPSPFIIGDSTVQGTAGAITSSANNIIAPEKTILNTYYQGNISLIPSHPILSIQPTPSSIPIFNLPTITLPFKGTQLQFSSDQFSEIPIITQNAFISKAITNALAQEKIGVAVPLIEELFNEEYTEYYGNDIHAQPQTITEIETNLERIAQETGKRTAVLYIISHPNSLELIAVLPNDKMVHKTIKEGDRQTLLQIVQEFRKRVASPLLRNDYKAPAEKLYQLLISPIEPTLKAAKIDNLLFAADSGLRLIPFAALYDGHQFLVEKYSLGIIPSFSLLNTHYNSLQNAHVLAMGASKFTGMNSLPSVKVELPTIVQLLGQKRFFINDAFTIENLQEQHELNPTQIIHLATHATFNAGAPHNSYIQFWGQEKLRLDNLTPLSFHNRPVELLVLSACRTALGDEKVELGFTGLAVRAGVKSALGSLWSVSDQGTLALMTEVYYQLRKVPIKAEALRQAQIAMITGNFSPKQANQSDTSSQIGLLKKENLSHPYYWAAFVLVGSPW